jgi:hypothetical protein
MFDVRDLSNTAIILLVIMVFASAVTVRALTVPAASLPITGLTTLPQELEVDPDMAFYMLPNDVYVEVGDTFAITVAAANVKDMFGWQAYVSFDPAVLECVGAFVPFNHVFSSRMTVSGALAGYYPEEFSQGPLQAIRNDEGWVLVGDCLLGARQPTFTGSGILCQIRFKAVSSGSTALMLLHDFAHDFQTYTLNFDLRATTASLASTSNIYVAPL